MSYICRIKLANMKSRLYTRTGDDGTTSLVGGSRTGKDSPRLEAYGDVDELNSWIGLLASSPFIDPNCRKHLLTIQNRLFDIGAILATEPESSWQPKPLSSEHIDEIEQLIDELDASLPPVRQFILPGGHPDSARAHIARTVARRAERRVIALSRTEPVDAAVIKYLNRISDLLYIIARDINVRTSTPEIFWQKDC